MSYISRSRTHLAHAWLLPANLHAQCGTGVGLRYALHVGRQDSQKTRCESWKRNLRWWRHDQVGCCALCNMEPEKS